MNTEENTMISVDITAEKIKAEDNVAFQDIDGYPEFLALIQNTYQENCANGTNLFVVEPTENLFELYLASLPEDRRQHYNCRACKKFFDNYGNLAMIDENNKIIPLFWKGTNKYTENFIFTKALFVLEVAVATGKVVSTFNTKEIVWGIPESHGWSHIYVKPYLKHVYTNALLEASQITAAKSQEHISLIGHLTSYRQEDVEVAIEYLKTGQLFNPEKVLPIAEKFLKLMIDFKSNKNQSDRNSMVWKYVVESSSAFNYIGSGMLGTLLDDIRRRYSLNDIMSKFNYKMDPKRYFRPQESSLSEGNIKRAEEIISKLGIVKSLPRRFATFEEIREYCSWLPNELVNEKDEVEGVFGKLLKKEKTYNDLPEVVVSWKKFKESCSQYDSIRVNLPNAKFGFTTITNSVDSEAPPIIQWDKAARAIGKCNGFSSYGYVNGTTPEEYAVKPGMNNVIGISPTASFFIPEVILPNMTNYDIIYIENSRDLKYDSGIGLFPEILISELHEIRSTIEAYSNSEVLIGRENNTANGIVIGSKNCINFKFEVTYKNFKQIIKIGSAE